MIIFNYNSNLENAIERVEKITSSENRAHYSARKIDDEKVYKMLKGKEQYLESLKNIGWCYVRVNELRDNRSLISVFVVKDVKRTLKKAWMSQDLKSTILKLSREDALKELLKEEV
jgi:hypothetical protein